MNWANKIAIVIIVFIGVMLFFVSIAFKQTNEMMEENYYDKEINYQSKLDAANLLIAASKKDIVSVINNHIVVQIPEALQSNFSNGKIEMICINNKKNDSKFSFTPDETGKYTYPNKIINSGKYRTSIAWQNNGKNYYKEQNIFIP